MQQDAITVAAFGYDWRSCTGVMPKWSRTYLPKNEGLGKPSIAQICLMLWSVWHSW